MTNEIIEKAKDWCQHFNCCENKGYRKDYCPLDGYENCKEVIQLYDRLQDEKEQVSKDTAKAIYERFIAVSSNDFGSREITTDSIKLLFVPYGVEVEE